MTYDMETTIQLPNEEDVDVFIEFEVTYWGHPGSGPSLSHPGEPPEPAEFEITKVKRLDNDEDITAAVEALTGDWYEKVYQLVADKVYEIDEERGYDD